VAVLSFLAEEAVQNGQAGDTGGQHLGVEAEPVGHDEDEQLRRHRNVQARMIDAIATDHSSGNFSRRMSTALAETWPPDCWEAAASRVPMIRSVEVTVISDRTATCVTSNTFSGNNPRSRGIPR
jgi:hypothetical protein